MDMVRMSHTNEVNHIYKRCRSMLSHHLFILLVLLYVAVQCACNTAQNIIFIKKYILISLPPSYRIICILKCDFSFRKYLLYYTVLAYIRTTVCLPRISIRYHISIMTGNVFLSAYIFYCGHSIPFLDR